MKTLHCSIELWTSRKILSTRATLSLQTERPGVVSSLSVLLVTIYPESALARGTELRE